MPVFHPQSQSKKVEPKCSSLASQFVLLTATLSAHKKEKRREEGGRQGRRKECREAGRKERREERRKGGGGRERERGKGGSRWHKQTLGIVNVIPSFCSRTWSELAP